jgi:peroxiredoxin (alkyl hydroperoxide reductase subunit C)
MYYPLNVGRNMEEIKRTLMALQTSDEHQCAMPLNWNTGDDVIIPAPKTITALAERKASNLNMVDWYLAKRSS